MRSLYLYFGLLISISACGGGSSSSESSQPSLPLNQAPTFTSASSVSINENAIGDIYTLTATDSDGTIARLDLSASSDSNFFAFNSATGVLSLPQYVIFDTPTDADMNNIYQLSFEAEDNDGSISTLTVNITVTEANLKARLPPSGNFELIDWKIDLPVDIDGNFSGDNKVIEELDLSNGYEDEFFFTGPDGGMVLRSPVIGATTPGSSFARTELREMLRRGDTSISTRGTGDEPNLNNWAFSSSPQQAQDQAGGVDGTLRVTLAVNSVTTTGSSGHIGRVIIGQIHAKDDEPIRLYYRKLPGNENGTIYAAHEVSGGTDIYYDIIGGRSNSEPNPVNGFELDELFTYEIIAVGNTLTVNILQNNSQIATQDIDMSASGYDVLDDFMYFKAGTYHVNNTADTTEFAQITIYELNNTHVGYAF